VSGCNWSSSRYSSRLSSEAWPENCLRPAIWTPCATLLEIAPALRVVLGDSGAVAPGLSGPFFDAEGDRIGVDRIGTNPVAVNTGFPLMPRVRGRRQPLQLPFGDLGGISRHGRLAP
jgi:hypothetical protein